MILSGLIRELVLCFRILVTAALLILISSTGLSGQEDEEKEIIRSLREGKESPALKERIFYGGNFGLQFGTITDIQFSPLIGLWVLPRIGVAAGPNYRYYKDPFGRTSIYGGRSYIQYLFLNDLNSIIPLGVHLGMFLHSEYEILSLESAFWKLHPYTTDRFITNTILAGAGISQYIGRRSALNLMVLWPLNDSGYGLYSNPEIRIGFVF